jgi:hypothetical protein
MTMLNGIRPPSDDRQRVRGGARPQVLDALQRAREDLCQQPARLAFADTSVPCTDTMLPPR